MSESRLKSADNVKSCTPEQRKLDVSEMHQRTQRYWQKSYPLVNAAHYGDTAKRGPGPAKICSINTMVSVQTVRAAGGGEASESNPEQTGSFREEQTEGQGVPQGKALKVWSEKILFKARRGELQAAAVLLMIHVFFFVFVFSLFLCRKLYRNFVPSRLCSDQIFNVF